MALKRWPIRKSGPNDPSSFWQLSFTAIETCQRSPAMTRDNRLRSHRRILTINESWQELEVKCVTIFLWGSFKLRLEDLQSICICFSTDPSLWFKHVYWFHGGKESYHRSHLSCTSSCSLSHWTALLNCPFTLGCLSFPFGFFSLHVRECFCEGEHMFSAAELLHALNWDQWSFSNISHEHIMMS